MDDSTRQAEWDDDIAVAMECDPALLPVLPELLADIDDLSGSPTSCVDLLQPFVTPAMRSALDLGCGKGGIAVELAKRFGWHVHGVDAMQPFIEVARARAEREGVTERCVFEDNEIRTFLSSFREKVDVVILSSVGPVFGDYKSTIGALREHVIRDGFMLIDDAHLNSETDREKVVYPGYVGRDEMLRQLTAHGEEIVKEVIAAPERLLRINQRNTALIRKRAEALVHSRPELSGVLEQYIARQEHETEVLGREVTCATWVLRVRSL